MDNSKLNLGRTIAVWVITAVGIILSVMLAYNIAPGVNENPTQLQIENEASAVSNIITYTMFLLGLVVASIVGFLIVSVVTNFQKQKKSLFTAALLIALAGIFYATADAEIPQSVIDLGTTKEDAIFASAGINLTLFLSAIAVTLAVFMGYITKYVLKK